MADGADLAATLRSRLASLAPEAERIALAVSGGGDSVALALLAHELGLEGPILHVDHGLRAESADDARAVEALAARLGRPFALARIDPRAAAARDRRNLADAARRLRWEALHRLAKEAGADAIAVGHTLDDQAETVLLQLLRGAAFARGMRARRGRVLRPLLDVRRDDLRSYLRSRGESWREDPSNSLPRSRRALVRHEVLPLLERLAPGASERLARHARLQGDVAELLDELARRRAGVGDGAALDARRLAGLPAALQRGALAALLRDAGAGVDLEHVEEARALLERRRPWRLSVGGDLVLEGAYGRLRVRPAADSAAARPEEREVATSADLPAGLSSEVLAAGPLVLRGRRPGDSIRLPGGRRSVTDLLVDRKVPRERRDALRVLARGSQVVWVEGVAIAVGAGPEAGLLRRDEERWMARALDLAREAEAAGEAPIGALVIHEGAITGEGRNRTEEERDPSAHAELLALRAAAAAAGDWRLTGATLVVTLEPCPMCFGAALQAHVGRIVYGAPNRREGALGGVADLAAERWKRRVRVEGGVLEREAAALLSRFFARRRAPRAGDEAP
jgi:tRNA(Ile)-lysidine synthase